MANGSWYEGGWELNHREGEGRQYDCETLETYEGQFHRDMKHGKGSTTLDSGDVHRGLYALNKRQGPGAIKYFNGNLFTGCWDDDLIVGKNCAMFYANGDSFFGEYRNGVRVGYGRYIFRSGEVIEGDWYGDLIVKGKIEYCNGDVYEGEISEGRKQGLGKYLYANGDEFKGYWRNDQKHGEAQFWEKDGASFVGYWHNNEFLSGVSQMSSGQKYVTPKKPKHASYFSMA